MLNLYLKLRTLYTCTIICKNSFVRIIEFRELWIRNPFDLKLIFVPSSFVICMCIFIFVRYCIMHNMTKGGARYVEAYVKKGIEPSDHIYMYLQWFILDRINIWIQTYAMIKTHKQYIYGSYVTHKVLLVKVCSGFFNEVSRSRVKVITDQAKNHILSP